MALNVLKNGQLEKEKKNNKQMGKYKKEIHLPKKQIQKNIFWS